MRYNITVLNHRLLPEDLKAYFVVYTWIVQISNAFLFLFTLYIVLKWSKDAVGTYKWYILWSIVNILFFLMIMASYEIEIFPAENCSVARGIIDYFQLSDYGGYFSAVSYSFYEMHIIITFCRFAFRYAQSTQQIRLLKLMSHRLFFTALLVLNVFLVIVSIIEIGDSAKHGKEFQLEYPSNNPAMKSYFTSHTVLVVKNQHFVTIFRFILFPLSLLSGLWCTWRCYRFRRHPKNNFSQRTRQMYRLLIVGLLIEQSAEFYWFIVPFLSIGFFFDVEDQVAAYYILYRTFYLYPTFVMVFTLVFYRRYREGVKKVYSAFWKVNSPTVTTSNNGFSVTKISQGVTIAKVTP
ncbi:unnamed protein product [Bursaphelenchus xylophilus]|uniref:(pine wood nematode) hypothetical protein n=1 Tax=Bursaphelenchus xylophilus TaxID=6326 RepID=A0A7I8XA56_BURXY|nr:unnamed protein product [Bursaphelenchus xylophilus]CAG9082276.1 unnamed protein product [Bursaphelenchus xylophilus]